ncbi:MAG TPA: NAD(P)-binding protein [Accumulibacter sp.]|nr:NAD(P)-binding protein [Accumulibacter sp.]HMW18152.1 NAD(P)-binding protein [Accumulibacter sp.]HNC18364.1 NAD(P)-binding protein [Accumulibacter sp.]HND80612.1 NAD(P)-binding protein [Accumulibacter sp.]HNE13150.1 NAD(P)-binding protein [Accumulibacter sp.]
MSIDRRDFLRALAAAGAAPLAACHRAPAPPLPPGELGGPSIIHGHRLRSGGFPPPSETRRVPVLIVGAGIGGLSAAWRLAKADFGDFALAELENEAGGNSRAGRNEVSTYPLGAHYLPLPNREATAVRALLAELGVLHGDPQAEKPVYDERYLCATPQERLYRDGRWQEGLLPQHGLSAAEQAQHQRFNELIDGYRQRRDRHGRRAFALPMALSSRDADLLALDRLTMRDWLLAQGLDAPSLHWYVDYTCRDDYGTRSAEVSAWAGIHYFASRDGKARNASNETVLTTPGGNAWLAHGLSRSITTRVGDRLIGNALAFRVAGGESSARNDRVVVDLWLPAEERTLRIETGQLIWAAPVFLLPAVFVGHPALQKAAAAYSYAPWLVANLTLSRPPEERHGAPPAWDNVLYQAAGLGYVIATHQRLRLRPGGTVWTYYRALDSIDPRQGRQLLHDTSREEWAEHIFTELQVAHPDLRSITTRLDIYRHPHAMARPLPGLLSGQARQCFAADGPHLRFAHADASGFSIFEEANYRGVLAAERTLRRLGLRQTATDDRAGVG